MLRRYVEKQGNEHDKVELSRRGFFGRLAVGAVLSMAMPGVVQAAKSTAVKADKNHRLAQSARSGVRLPKHSAIQPAKGARQTSGVATSHAVGKQQTLSAGKKPAVEREKLHAAHAEYHAQHDTRVHDVYTGKKPAVVTASNYTSRNPNQDGRAHRIIQPIQREPIVASARESVPLADHGRLATHRSLAFQNPHTGDKLSLTYFEKGRYLSDALNEINFLLRDYRTGDVHPIDTELLDQLHDMKQMLGLNQPFNVICGYRSPVTNAKLHAEHTGAANNSFHIHGRAVDIRIERFDLRRIHNAALAMHRGGVGYYPASNYIHLDTGTFRTWAL